MNANLNSILLVEDDPDIFSIIKMSLEEKGDKKVLSLEEFQASHFKPDVVLLDLIYKNKSVEENIKRFRNHTNLHLTKIIIISAENDLTPPTDPKLGVIGIISKPFNPIKLPLNIQTIWDKSLKTAKHDTQDQKLNEESRKEHYELKIKKLKEKYVQSLLDKHRFIEEKFHQMDPEHWDKAGFLELYKMVHHLYGTGTTFGFEEVTNASRGILESFYLIEQDPQKLNIERKKLESDILKLGSLCKSLSLMKKRDINEFN